MAWFGFLLAVLSVDPTPGKASEPPNPKPGTRWLKATAFAVPRETAPEGEGYFSIVEGHNERLYIGTHANGVNSWLVEFNPRIGGMKVVVDAHKAIGIDRKGFGSQAKIHTRNNVGKSGKIYFGTKQGYPAPVRVRSARTTPAVTRWSTIRKPASTRVYPIPVPNEGIISITPDEELGRRLHLDVLRQPPRPARERAIPGAGSGQGDVPGPD